MTEVGWSRAWAGVALIVLGAVFFAQSFFGYSLGNWWALLIFIPAVGALLNAYEHWQHDDRHAAGGSLTTGLLLSALAVVFLLDLEWRRIWPLFVIIIGVGMLLPTMFGRGSRRERAE